jgi:hypothetical protein
VTFFGDHPVLRIIALVVLLAAGLWVRLLDLTDPPLDIHPTRQLHSALMARGMYYQHVTNAPDWMVKTAIQQGKREAIIEPPILETITAGLYQVTGGENVWLARILSSVFWVLAGLAFYSLTASMTNPDGGMIATAVYLFLPYSVMASRTFQPDPLMVSLIVTSWCGFYRWREKPTWGWTIAGGLLTGCTIFVKNVSIFFLAIPFAVVLLQESIPSLVRNKKVWLFVILAIFPAAAYTIYGTYISHFLAQQFNFRFFPNLWITPANYSRWFNLVTGTFGLSALILSLVGLFLLKGSKHLRFVLGCWLGYIIYGFAFAYHIGTHDYYQLPFLPVAMLSIAPVGALMTKAWLENNPWKNSRLILGILMVALAAAAFWSNRITIQSNDFRPEVAFWRQLGDRLRDESVIGLTQDYGYRMEFYGWDSINNWMSSGDLALRDMAGRKQDSLSLLKAQIEGKHYFLVTWFDDFDRQKDVKDYLYATYPYEQGDGYVLFDLTQPR